MRNISHILLAAVWAAILCDTVIIVGALKFRVINDCVHPLERNLDADGRFSGAGAAGGGARVPGIAISVTAEEFYRSFAGIFRLSDGSRISAPAKERTESLRYMQELMYMVGVHVNESASRDGMDGGGAGDILQICGKVGCCANAIMLALFSMVVNMYGESCVRNRRTSWTSCSWQWWETL